MPRRRRFRLNVPLMGAIAVFVLAVVLYIGLGVLLAATAPKRMGVAADLSIALVTRCLDATLAIWFFAVGASIGSFLNVVAYRLPLGRTLGGHSACPYCCTRIATVDNIPVFAWLGLRGRCRTCHLPISIQYPLIELTVGLLFLSAYFFEFAIAGSNLPGTGPAPAGLGLVWMSVTPVLGVRMFLFLFTLSGLVAAALIARRRVDPPISLFICLLLVATVGQVVKPASVIVAWASPAGAGLSMLDASITIGLGTLTGLAAAALTMPFLQRATSYVGWSGVLACIGSLVGWQWVMPVACGILATTLVAGSLIASLFPMADAELNRGLGQKNYPAIADPVVWAWLAVLLFRSQWKSFDFVCSGISGMPHWMTATLFALAAVPLALWLGRDSQVDPPPQ